MDNIIYEKLNQNNFNVNSLDSFIRHQEVTECLRFINGEWKLVENKFIEDWDLNKRRNIAETILKNISLHWIAYGAFSDGQIAGYIVLSDKRFGSRDQYIELTLFHVSEPFRRMGIGTKLFGYICNEAKSLGAEKLYISAHSSAESQAVYRRLGCIHAAEINAEIAANEPCDVQLECIL